MDTESTGVTQLLKAWSGGDRGALQELTPKVYVELRRTAARYMRDEKSGNTLQATALVHEVFLRLVDVASVSWQDRAHFFAVSANMMRRILVAFVWEDAAVAINLDDAPEIAAGCKGREIVAIDEALDALSDNRPAQSEGD